MAASNLVYSTHGKKYKAPRECVSSLNELRRGDHIAFHRYSGAILHHAIVEDIDKEEGEFTVIEYTNTTDEVIQEIIQDIGQIIQDNCIPTRIAKVVRTNCKFQDEDVYLFKHEECLNPDEVVSRAQSRLGEGKYNPFTNNCEHFAMWCKTGRPSSDQIDKAKAMLFKEVVENTRPEVLQATKKVLETAPKVVEEIIKAVIDS